MKSKINAKSVMKAILNIRVLSVVGEVLVGFTALLSIIYAFTLKGGFLAMRFGSLLADTLIVKGKYGDDFNLLCYVGWLAAIAALVVPLAFAIFGRRRAFIFPAILLIIDGIIMIFVPQAFEYTWQGIVTAVVKLIELAVYLLIIIGSGGEKKTPADGE